MGWLSTDAGAATNFLLGRPTFETQFSVNPESISIEEAGVAIRQRMLNGSMKKSVLNPSMPIIKISSKYLTLAQRNQLASLAMVDDTFLSFITRDDWQVIALRVIPTTVSTLTLPKLSCLRLSKSLVDLGGSSIITINQVYGSPFPGGSTLYNAGGFNEGEYDGPEYFSGGSYADSTYIVTLGTALANVTDPVYVTFTYKGWLVDVEKFGHNSQGQNIDWFAYDFQLTGA